MQYKQANPFVVCYNYNRIIKKMSYLNLQQINRLIDTVLIQDQLLNLYKNIALSFKFQIIQNPQEIRKLANTINNRMLKITNSNKQMNKGQSNESNHWGLGELKLFKTIVALYSICYSISIPSFSDKNIKELQEIFHSKPPIIIQYEIAALARKSRKWSEGQNNLLSTIMKNYPQPNWKNIVIELFSLSSKQYFRQFTQCREHWNTRLSPHIKKQKWTVSQDYKLLRLIEANGFKWSLISKKMDGERSEHTVKNRYNCLRKKLNNNKKEYTNNSIEQFIVRLQNKRNEQINNRSSQICMGSGDKQEESITTIPQKKQQDSSSSPVTDQFPIEIYLNFDFSNTL